MKINYQQIYKPHCSSSVPSLQSFDISQYLAIGKHSREKRHWNMSCPHGTSVKIKQKLTRCIADAPCRDHKGIG